MDRRKFILGSTSALTGSLWLPGIVGSAAAQDLPAGAVASGILDALPGKRPLIKRSFRPPNYETPVSYFREAFTPNDAFYVRWHTGVPDVALADWRLRIAGPGVKSEREFTYDSLRRKFKTVEVAAVNQCSGNRRGLFNPHVAGVQWGFGAMGNAVWSGVRLKDVLEDAGLNASALEVVGDGAEAPALSSPDFVKSLPMWKALDPDTLIAFEMNGEPLPGWNGAPARLVAPGWTATYWIKALAELSVTDKPFDGFWMKTAYRVPKGMFGASGFESQDTEQNSPITAIKVNSLVVDPAPGAVLERGKRVEVLGIAWDGGSGIRNVEVSLDGGRTWRDAKLQRDLGRYSWRQWRHAIKPEQAGAMTVMARAHARDGSTQSETLVHNPAGYHHNVVQKADYHVA
ncbi:MAG: molybdopterin-dependent oxidoreductase [Steroidobacteraceae bacterium]|nr:molybdopterin-dependent oxidoreductase [Steroidobacteraceae bacterium]MBP7013907.1 molybdopterin-dependent oxidoreductase [Steroidobacteraceae bacterium]